MEKLGYSVEEAVEVSGIGRSALYERMSAGELESIKVGRRRIIPAAALREWMDRLRADQARGGAAA